MAFESGYKSIQGSLTGISNHIFGAFDVISSGNNCVVYFGGTELPLVKYRDLESGLLCDFGDGLQINAIIDSGFCTINLVKNSTSLLSFTYSGVGVYDVISLVDINGFVGVAFFTSDNYKSGYVAGFNAEYYGIEPVNISDEYGESSKIDGYSNGTFDDSSDVIPIPDLPTVGYCSTGGYAYELSSGELNSLINEVFQAYTPLESADTGIEKVGIMMENVAKTLVQFLNSQFVQYVTDLHVIPVSPPTGSRERIRLGARSLETTSTKIVNDYVEVDCGTLNIGEYYANFIDYVGTVCKLYLPAVGFVDVKNEWFQSGLLNVTYHYNVIDGTFMCYLKSSSSKSNLKDSVVASYGGNCCVHLPFVGANYSNVLSGLVSTVNGASSITPQPIQKNESPFNNKGTGLAWDIGGAAESSINLLSNVGGTVTGSNNYNSNSAFLGIRTPYLYIERVVSDFSETYAKENGLPTNVSFKIEELSGYTEIENIHLDGLNCTDDEKNEIFNILRSGIIL